MLTLCIKIVQVLPLHNYVNCYKVFFVLGCGFDLSLKIYSVYKYFNKFYDSLHVNPHHVVVGFPAVGQDDIKSGGEKEKKTTIF